MKDFMAPLQICLALLFLISKIFLLFKYNKTAWIFGLLGTLICIQYFLMLQLYIYVGLEICMLPLMFSGLVKSKSLDLLLYIVVFVCLGGLLYFTTRGELTNIEFISSIAFVLATYALTHDEEIVGWTLLIGGHMTMGYITYIHNQYIFAGFQILSVIISLIALFPKTSLKIIWLLGFILFTLLIFPWGVLWISDQIDDFIYCSWGFFPEKPVTCPICNSKNIMSFKDCKRCDNCGSIL